MGPYSPAISPGSRGVYAPPAEAASYAFALTEARRRNNRKALKALRAIGPPPYSAKSLWTQRTWLSRFEGHLNVQTLWQMMRIFPAVPELSMLDFLDFMRRFRASFEVMWAEVSTINLMELVPALQMPVFFFLGRHDHWVPPETSVAYFDLLTAPSKRPVWFEQSGQEPFADEPAKFNAAMVDLVRPVVVC